MQLDETLSYPGGHRLPWDASVKALRHSVPRARTHTHRERGRVGLGEHMRARTHTHASPRTPLPRPAACERGFSRYQMSSGHRFAFGGPICSIARETARARVHSDVRGRGHQVGCCFASPLLKESAKESHPPHPAWAVCVAATPPPGGAAGARQPGAPCIRRVQHAR